MVNELDLNGSRKIKRRAIQSSASTSSNPITNNTLRTVSNPQSSSIIVNETPSTLQSTTTNETIPTTTTMQSANEDEEQLSEVTAICWTIDDSRIVTGHSKDFLIRVNHLIFLF